MDPQSLAEESEWTLQPLQSPKKHDRLEAISHLTSIIRRAHFLRAPIFRSSWGETEHLRRIGAALRKCLSQTHTEEIAQMYDNPDAVIEMNRKRLHRFLRAFQIP